MKLTRGDRLRLTELATHARDAEANPELSADMKRKVVAERKCAAYRVVEGKGWSIGKCVREVAVYFGEVA